MGMYRLSAAFLAPVLVSLTIIVWSGAVVASDEPPAQSDLAHIREIFSLGDFSKAAEEARKIDVPGAAALAARAALAEGDFDTDVKNRRDVFVAAERDARRAIARDPRDPEGHLYLALALGFLGRMDGSLTAHFAGYADEARTHIDLALALDPQSAWAYALDGGWNLEISRDGGLLGEHLYGASPEKGMASYRKALSLEPGNTAIAYQYALQLLAIGGATHRAEAHRVLARSLGTKPTDREDAVELLARYRAQRLKLAMDTHDELTLKFILREALGNFSGPRGGAAERLQRGHN